MNKSTGDQSLSPEPSQSRRSSPIIWVVLFGFLGVGFILLSLARLFVSSETATPAPSPPSGSYVERQASVSLRGTVSFEVTAYDGTSNAAAAARSVFEEFSWADLSRFKIDMEEGEIVVGVEVKGDAFSTTAAKSALEEVGFSIGRTGLSSD